jgi:poly-gamma-glutamate capsule biosynthesis protein CapA/YwtB (metallophosphatase superfamily)
MNASAEAKSSDTEITLFLCGDVMAGRGIDQVLPHPGDPAIHEPYLKTARGYVDLAEKTNGPIPRPVDFSYPWGDALEEMDRAAPDLRIINLETSITVSDEYWKDKEIHYRMNPKNVPFFSAARIDCAVLANNHILDWGYSGLKETLETLERANLRRAGAGRDLKEAETPAVMEAKGKGRVIVFSLGSATSGIPFDWAAAKDRPGLNFLEDLSPGSVKKIGEKVLAVKKPGDLVVASIHWGGNWGYRIPPGYAEFSHELIDRAGVDVVHGHSSHHAKAVEVYRGKLILYGCGDFLNDYEAISGYETFRGDLALMYFPTLDPSTGKLLSLAMTPLQIRRFRLNRVSPADGEWLSEVLSREGEKFGTRVRLEPDQTLSLRWD